MKKRIWIVRFTALLLTCCLAAGCALTEQGKHGTDTAKQKEENGLAVAQPSKEPAVIRSEEPEAIAQPSESAAADPEKAAQDEGNAAAVTAVSFSADADEREFYAAALNRTALLWYAQLQHKENLVISPYGLTTMLAMLADIPEGNAEITKQVKALYKVTDLADLVNALKSNNRFMEEWEVSEKLNNVNMAAYLPGPGWQEPAFSDARQKLTQDFASGWQTLSGNTEQDAAAINSWSDDVTEGMIPELVTEDALEGMHLLLANAVYFEDKWEIPFDGHNTKTEAFHTLSGETQVQMMHGNVEGCAYLESEGIRVLSLPYTGNFVMDVMIPADKSRYIGDLFDALSVEEQLSFVKSLQENERRVKVPDLALPKFAFDYHTEDLIGNCKQLGITSCFDPGTTDFARIWQKDGQNLYVSLMFQKARIEVDEEGTRAAAVTVGAMSEGAAMPPDYEEIAFYVDCPFMYLIRDRVSGNILFMGIVTRP